MIFTTTSLLFAGLCAATIPIAIHLLSKGKPRKVVFAAIRFAQSTLVTNRRKLRLKRFLLLTLRVALLVLLGYTLARPILTPKNLAPIVEPTADANDENVVGAETAGLSGKDAPVAAAIVVDTSLRMGRVKDNATLLARATATARTIMERLPKGSELAVLDGTPSGDGFQSDRFAAKTRLAKLEIEPGGRSAAETTLVALALVKSSKLTRREIYVLTDETTAGWSDRDLRRIRRAVGANNKDVASGTEPTFYFVDLGDDSYRNVSILDATPAAETICEGGALRVDSEIERVDAEPGDATIEALFFNAKDLPNAISAEELAKNEKLAFRSEKQTLSFESGRAKRDAVFNVSGLPVGSCVGLIRTLGKDALAADDARAFVVDVVPEWKLLVVAPRPIAEKALFLTQALAPDELKKTGRAPFELDVVPYEATQSDRATENARDLVSANKRELERYRAIFLLDPPGLAPETIETLTEYANDGGGVAVFLGRAAAPLAAFQTPEALALLGCKPTTQETSRNLMIAPISYDAPLLSEFRPFERGGIPWDAAPIRRYWKLEEPSATTTIVARFQPEFSDDVSEDAPPAIVENRVGLGLVATVATPISDGAQEKPWNSLTSSDAIWVFVVLVDSMARRLASSSSSILNYTTGESATLRAELKEFPAVATIYAPSGEEIATPTDVERRQIRFPGVKTPGICRVRTTPNRAGDAIDRVFAVTTPGEESDMTRRTPEEWLRLWDGLPYKTLDVDAAADEMESRDGEESEPYALLVVILAALFVFETFVSNRFYKDSPATIKSTT